MSSPKLMYGDAASVGGYKSYRSSNGGQHSSVSVYGLAIWHRLRNILMGLIRQDRGDVRVLGHDMPDAQVAAKWEIGFAWSPQHFI